MPTLPLFLATHFVVLAIQLPSGQQQTRLLMLTPPWATEDPCSSSSLWLMSLNDWLGWVSLLFFITTGYGAELVDQTLAQLFSF